ncbi:MAG: hypothetical protein J5896_02500 [Alphaproteobacteria bacterium]|nr:hypothetical protein [Alphaproteobacteria bacterium]
MKKIIFLALVLVAPVCSAAYENTCGTQCQDDFGLHLTSEQKQQEMSVCEALGYSSTANCSEGYIVCPFDSNYIWCKAYDCEMGGLYGLEKSQELVTQQQYQCSQTEFHGLTCYSCTETKETCAYNEDNKGVGELKGDPCKDGSSYKECTSLCYEKNQKTTIDTIEGATPVWEVCRGCMKELLVATNLRCRDGYTRIECEGSNCSNAYTYIDIKDGKKATCIPTPCGAPVNLLEYGGFEASNRKDCAHETGDKAKVHPEGWLLETNGISGKQICSRCIPKDCPVDTEKGKTGCAQGYLYTQRGYSGDEPCGYCDSMVCPAPYNENIEAINDCPTMSVIENGQNVWSAAKAWDIETLMTLDGEGHEIPFTSEGKNCNVCAPKKCNKEQGYSETIQSIKDCDNEKGYTFVYDNTTFYGYKYCGKCVIEQCPDESGSTMDEQKCAEQMHGSTIGVRLETVGYSGAQECKKCVCEPSANDKCQYTDDANETDNKYIQKGTGGELRSVCCDGKYQICENKTCGGTDITKIENGKIQNAKTTRTCTACGVEYLEVTECNEGYEITQDNKCAPKACSTLSSELGLMFVDQGQLCGEGYHTNTSDIYPWCAKCDVKTCADWGLESNNTKFDNGTKAPWYDALEVNVACDDGYVPTTHTKKVGAVDRACFECSKKNVKENYIDVPSTSAIPDYVLSPDVIKSGEGYQYCASGCDENRGYVKDGSGCGCIGVECGEGFGVVAGLTRTSDGFYTNSNGALKYEACMGAGVLKYKYIGCMNGYQASVTCNTESGEIKVGQLTSPTCVKCLCDMTNMNCPWTATNAGQGNLQGACCDGLSYKQCFNTCTYTLTAADIKNALETESCSACGKTYYKIKKCREGYTGPTCSECDTANGYDRCVTTGKCIKTIDCGHGNMVCSSEGHFICSCAKGYTGNTCNQCKEANGYYKCDDECSTKPVCQHGSPVCPGNGNGWQCQCETGYAGSTCAECDTANNYKRFGEVCLEDRDCGHGIFNGINCECDKCFGGENCTTLDELCYEYAEGKYKPKQCEQFGYSKTCKEYQNCEPKSEATYGGDVLNCFEVSNQTCQDFCGRYTTDAGLSEASLSVADSIYCKSIPNGQNLYAINTSVYSWLLEEGGSIGVEDERGMLVDEDNLTVVGKVENGKAVDETGRVIGTIKSDGKTVVKTEPMIVGRVVDGTAIDNSGNEIGTVTDGTAYDAQNNVIGTVDAGGNTIIATREIEIGTVQDDNLIVTPKVIGIVIRKGCEGNVCEYEKSCYFNDNTCSKGTMDIEGYDLNEYRCDVVGHTPAGSACYECKKTICPTEEGDNENAEYVPSRDVETKTAAGYRCTAKTGKMTGTGEQCYECFADTCPDGYFWSKDQITMQYRYPDDLVLPEPEESSGEEVTVIWKNPTRAGHYCYEQRSDIDMRYCSTVLNQKFETAAGCEAYISGVKNVQGQFIAACHQCVSDDNTLYWYPACKDNYDAIPVSGGYTYQFGYNCCSSETQGYTPIIVNISEFKLGPAPDDQTCYALSRTCDGTLADDEYCVGTKCDVVECTAEQYPYYNDGAGTKTIPAHATATGETCIPTSNTCATTFVYYKDFACNEQKTMNWKGTVRTFNTHVKGASGCECNEKQHFFASDEDCRGAEENSGHRCQEDEEVGCFIIAGCDEAYGYDTETRCKELHADFVCNYDSVTQCWLKGSCDTDKGKYTDKTNCEEVYDGHICAQPEGKDCFEKSVCDISKGFYDTMDGCLDARGLVEKIGDDGKPEKDSDGNPIMVEGYIHEGMTCKFNGEVECYVPDDCDIDQGFYASIDRCEAMNQDLTCKSAPNTRCAIVDACDTEQDMWESQAACVEHNLGRLCTKRDSGCWTSGGCDTTQNYYDKKDACETANPKYTCAMGDKTDANTDNTCYRPTTACNHANGYYNITDENKPDMYIYSDAHGVCDEVVGCNNAAGYYDDQESCESTNFKCESGKTDNNKTYCWKRTENCFDGFVKTDATTCVCPTGRILEGKVCQNECHVGYWKNGEYCVENTCNKYKNANKSSIVTEPDGFEGSCEDVDTECNHCSDYVIDLPADSHGNARIKSCRFQETEKTCAELPCIVGKNGNTDVCWVKDSNENGASTLDEVREAGEFELAHNYPVGHMDDLNTFKTCRTCQSMETLTCSKTKDCSDYPYRSDYAQNNFVADKTSESCTKYMESFVSCQTFYKERKCKAGAHWTGTECVVCDSFVLRWSEEAKKCVSVYCNDASVKYEHLSVLGHIGDDCGYNAYWNDSAKQKVRDASDGCNDGRLSWYYATTTTGYDCYGRCTCPK